MGRWPLVLAGVLLLLIPSAVRSQIVAVGPVRDQPRPPAQAGTGSIKGRVVALDSGMPLRRVQLMLASEPPSRGRVTFTDAEGKYEFKKLPAGRYNLSAMKGGYVRLQYGQRGPRDSGHPLELADRQTLDKIDIALPRGGVIVGRVVDEVGEPVIGQSVQASNYRIARGKRHLTTANQAQTNDIGQYRIFGLPPGEYYVSATSHDNLSALENDDTDDTPGYSTTYYPGTPDPAEAQRVTVGIGQEVVADIQLVLTKVSRVSGTVVMSSGKAPLGGMVMLRPRDSDVGFGGGSGPIRPDGSFVINGVAAGSYHVMAVATDGERLMSGPDAFETAALPIVVNGVDIGGLHLTATRGTTIKGHVTFEGGTPDATVVKQTMPVCIPVDQDSMMFSGQPKPPNDQGEFEIVGVRAACTFNLLSQAGTWTLKSVLLNGVDVTDKAIEPGDKPLTGLEVIMTNRITTLTGSVQDSHDQPAKEYVVVAFPEDNERWTPPASGRYIRSSRPDQAGTFKVQGLPPARYLLVALEHVEEGAEQDPEFLARIRHLGTRVDLDEGAMQTVSLKMSVAPEP